MTESDWKQTLSYLEASRLKWSLPSVKTMSYAHDWCFTEPEADANISLVCLVVDWGIAKMSNRNGENLTQSISNRSKHGIADWNHR